MALEVTLVKVVKSRQGEGLEFESGVNECRTAVG
jgi:hypothetical protein